MFWHHISRSIKDFWIYSDQQYRKRIEGLATCYTLLRQWCWGAKWVLRCSMGSVYWIHPCFRKIGRNGWLLVILTKPSGYALKNFQVIQFEISSTPWCTQGWLVDLTVSWNNVNSLDYLRSLRSTLQRSDTLDCWMMVLWAYFWDGPRTKKTQNPKNPHGFKLWSNGM